MTNCNFLSLNVRSLKKPKKTRNLFLFKGSKLHFLYLRQETYSERQDELIWKSEWGAQIFSPEALVTRKVSVFC